MYLQTGLGQPSAPLSKHKLIGIKRNQCQIWIPCEWAQWQLLVPFRKGYDNFREEVRQAIGKRVTFRSDRGAFVDAFLNKYAPQLTELYNDMLKGGVEESSPIGILVTIKYTPGLKKELDISMP
jgi:hypothetical protein